MEGGHYFLKEKNNLFTPSSIFFTLLIDCAVVTSKKMSEELQSLLEQKSVLN